MTPKTVEELFTEWKAKRDSLSQDEEFLTACIASFFKREDLDFSYFKLKRDVHENKKPCHIYGIAHDWIATYPDSDWKPQHVVNVVTDFKKVKDGRLLVQLVYQNGDYNFAEVPLKAMDTSDSFKEWYDEELANYKANRDELAQYIKHRDEITRSEEFKHWLTTGDKYVQLGLVRVTAHGEEVLNG